MMFYYRWLVWRHRRCYAVFCRTKNDAMKELALIYGVPYVTEDASWVGVERRGVRV